MFSLKSSGFVDVSKHLGSYITIALLVSLNLSVSLLILLLGLQSAAGDSRGDVLLENGWKV